MKDSAKAKFLALEKEAKEKYVKAKAEYDKTATPKEKEKKQGKGKKQKADSNAPKRAWPPFFFYQQQRMPELKKEHPDKSHKEKVSLLGEEWRGLTEQQKQPYIEK